MNAIAPMMEVIGFCQISNGLVFHPSNGHSANARLSLISRKLGTGLSPVPAHIA